MWLKEQCWHTGIRDNAGIKTNAGMLEFGKGVTVINPVNLYECSVGDGSFVGPFVEIQKGVKIGKHCRIQSHAFICELVMIGDDCFISHGAMFINDSFSIGGPAGGDKNLWQSTQIGNHVSIGTNATILPVRICDNVVIGAGSVVTKDIDEAGVYVGNPIRRLRRLHGLGKKGLKGGGREGTDVRGLRSEVRKGRMSEVTPVEFP